MINPKTLPLDEREMWVFAMNDATEYAKHCIITLLGRLEDQRRIVEKYQEPNEGVDCAQRTTCEYCAKERP